MEVRPGDRVLIPVVESLSSSEIQKLGRELGDRFPQVKFGVIDGSSMTHALVYRGTGDSDDEVHRAAQKMSALAADKAHELSLTRERLTLALDLLDQVLARFNDKGSVGSIDNVRRTGWVDNGTLAEWETWVSDARNGNFDG